MGDKFRSFCILENGRKKVFHYCFGFWSSTVPATLRKNSSWWISLSSWAERTILLLVAPWEKCERSTRVAAQRCSFRGPVRVLPPLQLHLTWEATLRASAVRAAAPYLEDAKLVIPKWNLRFELYLSDNFNSSPFRCGTLIGWYW